MKLPSTTTPTRFCRNAALLSALFAAATMLAAGPAHAQTEAEQAEALIREGVRLRAQDQTPKALPLFEKAYQLSRTPRTAAQLGLCELELGYYVAAERYLNEALASPEHPWIAKNKLVLKRQLDAAMANIGELVLTVSPAGADVLLNHNPVDSTQLAGPIRLNKGPVDVDVRAAGFEPAHETIVIAGGKRERRTFALVAAASPLAARPPVEAGSPSPGSGPAPAGTTETSPASATRAGRGERLAAWVTAGVAVGALAFGTAEAFNAASKRDAFNSHTGTMGGVAYQDCGTANLSPACKPLKDAYDQARALTIVGFVATGALAAASAVLFVLSSPDRERSPDEARTARAFACVPDLAARGVGCALRF
jgi:tetratricopeptide (TPR) repeat protein